MISLAPVQAAQAPAAFAEKIATFIAVAKDRAQNGLTLSEFGELTVALLQVVMTTIDVLPVTGAEKKVWAVDAAAALFDAFADSCVPTLAYPFWLLSRAAVRAIFLHVVSGAIESLLPLVRAKAAAAVSLPVENS